MSSNLNLARIRFVVLVFVTFLPAANISSFLSFMSVWFVFLMKY